MNAIAALKKAHQAQAINKDTYTLKEFYYKFLGPDKKARLNIVGIESKYVPKFDKRDAPAGVEGAGSLGFRTRFILNNGETVGTFSNGVHETFRFFARIMQQDGDLEFLHIDIKGNVLFDVTMVDLGGGKGTYNLEMVEEGSDVQGFTDYLPTAQNILALDSGQVVDTETGEVSEAAPEVEAKSKK